MNKEIGTTQYTTINAVEINKGNIENNARNIDINTQGIKENKKRIQENKSEIDKIREENRWHAEADKARFERIIYKLIRLVIIVIAVTVISNALWLYAWNQRNGTGIFNKTTNTVAQEGNISDSK